MYIRLTLLSKSMHYMIVTASLVLYTNVQLNESDEYILRKQFINFIFKWGLRFSTSAIKLFYNGTKLFKATIATATLQVF